jgi:hypothetical protein
MIGTELQEDSMTEASVNFGTGVSNAWSNVATFIPKFIMPGTGPDGAPTLHLPC